MDKTMLVIAKNKERRDKIASLSKLTGESEQLCAWVVDKYNSENTLIAMTLGATEVGVVKSIVSPYRTPNMSELERVIWFSQGKPTVMAACCAECKNMKGTLCRAHGIKIENSVIRRMHTMCDRFNPYAKQKKKEKDNPKQMMLSFEGQV